MEAYAGDCCRVSGQHTPGVGALNSVVLALADRFAAAAVDSTQWMPALQSLADATRSECGQLIGIGSASTVPFNWVSGLPETVLSEFVSIDGGNPRINPRVAVSVGVPVLKICSEVDYVAARPTMASDVYADFAHDHGITHGCQTKLIENSRGIVGLAVLRNDRQGETTEEVRALFSSLAPFVRSAVQTQIALEHAGAQLIGGALDAVGAAVFVCEADARVAAMSGPAEAMVRDGRLRIADGRLDAVLPRDVAALRVALGRVLTGAERLLQTIAIEQPGQLPLLLDICPAPRAAWHFNFRPQALVVARSSANWHASSATILQQLYRLSAAEADVALRLAGGESRESIAASRDASLGTVRAQLKSAFAKLGVGREVELAAMLGGLLRR